MKKIKLLAILITIFASGSIEAYMPLHTLRLLYTSPMHSLINSMLTSAHSWRMDVAQKSSTLLTMITPGFVVINSLQNEPVMIDSETITLLLSNTSSSITPSLENISLTDVINQAELSINDYTKEIILAAITASLIISGTIYAKYYIDGYLFYPEKKNE